MKKCYVGVQDRKWPCWTAGGIFFFSFCSFYTVHNHKQGLWLFSALHCLILTTPKLTYIYPFWLYLFCCLFTYSCPNYFQSFPIVQPLYLAFSFQISFQDTDTLWLDYQQSITEKCLTCMDTYMIKFPDIKVGLHI